MGSATFFCRSVRALMSAIIFWDADIGGAAAGGAVGAAAPPLAGALGAAGGFAAVAFADASWGAPITKMLRVGFLIQSWVSASAYG